MPTQLNYSFITRPNLGYLTAGQTTELEFTVSNPGAAVTLFSLAFTFPYGSAGSDLCASVSDVSAKVLPGPGWTAGTDKSGNFVLRPPGNSISIGLEGLAFTLSIEVNSQVGVVNLNSSGPVQSFTVEEITDAGKAYWSPPDPLSKFPVEFQFSGLSANPSVAEQGEAIVLSWTGTSGATYTIDWTDLIYSGGQQPPITDYADTVFPPEGTGETLTAGPDPTAVVSVTAEYSSGDQTLQTAPLSVPVGVKLDAPTITSFTATWQGPVLELNWATENATSVEIPAITSDTQNPNGNYPFTPSSTQPLPSTITLIARNQASQTSQTLEEAYQQVEGSPVPVGDVPVSVAVSPDCSRVFVASLKDNTLAVLDVHTLQPVTGTPVPVGTDPMSVAVSPDGKRVYVANSGDNTVTVLDTETLQPVTGSPAPVGLNPRFVTVSPDNSRVFVATSESGGLGGALTVLDAGTLQPIAGSPVSFGVTADWFEDVALQLMPLAVSPDGKRVYVANFQGGLTILDAQTLRPISSSPVIFDNTASTALSPDGMRVFVANVSDPESILPTDSALIVLDAGTLQPIIVTRVPGGSGLWQASFAVSPDGRRVYVRNFDGGLTVLDAGTLQPITGSWDAVGFNLGSIAASADGKRVCVTNINDNTLKVFTGEGQYA